MNTLVYAFILSLAGLALGVALYLAIRGVRAYARTRGKRLVTCPETHCTAAVESPRESRSPKGISRRNLPLPSGLFALAGKQGLRAGMSAADRVIGPRLFGS